MIIIVNKIFLNFNFKEIIMMKINYKLEGRKFKSLDVLKKRNINKF
jgi:hypothetical protein